MLRLIVPILIAVTAAADAHPSLVPHEHPHGVSILPDLGTIVVASIVLFSGALLAYAKWRGE